MLKAVFLVDTTLLSSDFIKQKAVEIYTLSAKELIDESSGKDGSFLVSLKLSQWEYDLLVLAGSRDETFGIQKTEYAITEEV